MPSPLHPFARHPRVLPQRNRNPVPRIDRRHHQRQIHRLHIREVRPHLLIHRIRSMPLLNIRHCLRPRQRRPLPLRIEIRIPPLRNPGNPVLLSRSVFFNSARMQLNAVLTPIHQRNPQPHQLQQRTLQPRPRIQVVLQLPHLSRYPPAPAAIYFNLGSLIPQRLRWQHLRRTSTRIKRSNQTNSQRHRRHNH